MTDDPITAQPAEENVLSEENTQNSAEIPVASTENGAQVLVDMEQMIKNHIVSIDQRKTELKKLKEMIASTLLNDATYKEQDDEVKKVTKIRNSTKKEILRQPANAQISKKVQELSAELKELNGALSDYLREFARLSGSTEIEGDDGEVHDIIYIAKLVKKSSKFR